MNLHPEQEQAVEGALKVLRRGYGEYRIGGYAGTGKTTVIKAILERYNQPTIVSAFCGKAAGVLRKKGVKHADTIHSSIYDFDASTKRFVLRRHLFADAFIIDEGSMVPRPLWEDVCTFNVPRIIVGDPGQLEPIGDDACLLDTCDIVLEYNHRNEGSIADFANEVRRTGEFPDVQTGPVRVRNKSDFRNDFSRGDRFDIYLCGFNKTRVALNQYIMGAKRLPHVDDRMIILMNNKPLGVFNGSIVTITKIREFRSDYYTVDFDCDGKLIPEVRLSLEAINNPKFNATRRNRDVVYADYGYSATVHKFQGSETENVCYFDEQCDAWSATNHRYTGCTRAIDNLWVYTD